MKTYEHFLMQSALRLYQVILPMVTSKEAAVFIVRIITLPARAATSFVVMITSPQCTENGTWNGTSPVCVKGKENLLMTI